MLRVVLPDEADTLDIGLDGRDFEERRDDEQLEVELLEEFEAELRRGIGALEEGLVDDDETEALLTFETAALEAEVVDNARRKNTFCPILL